MFKISELVKATGGKLICGNKNLAVNGVSTDSRSIKNGEVFIAIKGENFDGYDFIDDAIRKGASCIIGDKIAKSAVACIKVNDPVKALGDIAHYHRKKFCIPIVAVTGSNGKTTTKDMIAWLLQKDFCVLKNEGTKNNHIGLPVTLLKLRKEHQVAVLEAGTNHFGEVAYLSKVCEPNIGVITNIGPSHLEHLKDLNGVFKEKYTLINKLKSPYIGILNSDDALLNRQLVSKIRKPFILGFGIKEKSDFNASGIKYHASRIEFYVNCKNRFTLNTLGAHNIYNALAAIAVARIIGLEYNDIAARLAEFSFPQGRLNLIKLKNVSFIDDTYNSNPLSLSSALETLSIIESKGRKIFVMGDMLELGGKKELLHQKAGAQVARVCDTLISVGILSKFAAEAAEKHGLHSDKIFTCNTSTEAKDILFNRLNLHEDDIVLVKGSRCMKMEEIFK